MFEKTAYLVKERVAFAKLADIYDIVDAETGAPVAVACEKPGWAIHIARFIVSKKLLPTKVTISRAEGEEPFLTVQRGFTFLRSHVTVLGGDGARIGCFKSKILSLGGGFYVYDDGDRQVAEVKGDWKGWNFRFLDAAGNEIGAITKKWAGIGKELFTSADNYVVSLSEGADRAAVPLLMAAAIAIDTVYKE